MQQGALANNKLITTRYNKFRACIRARILSLSSDAALSLSSLPGSSLPLIASALFLYACLTTHALAQTQKSTSSSAFTFSIPAQDANEALTELAKQANTTLLFPFDLAKRVKTNALEGEFTLNQALRQLLEGTELAVVTDESGKVSIRSRASLIADKTPEKKQTRTNEDKSFGLEKIAVVGTRSSPRSVVDSPVPLDIIDSESLG